MAENAGEFRIQPEQMREALTADADGLYGVIRSNQEEVLLAALRNPRLGQQHVLALLKRRLPGTVIAAINADKRLVEAGPVRLALAAHPDTPLHIAQSLLSRLFVFDLLTLCCLPRVSPDIRMAAERKIIQQLLPQPLGNKLTLARRGTSAIVDALLREGVPRVVEVCLDNPRLKEGSLYGFLSSSQASTENVVLVARNSRWKSRPNIRLAILKNPRTPLNCFVTLLSEVSAAVLHDLLAFPRLPGAQKDLVRRAVGRLRA